MDLVNEYLRIVANLLPKGEREDIVAELRDTILSRIEARESELGRPLTDDETEAVLREVGHPLVIAARYREGPQHLVGPTLYPYWLFAVKAAIVLQVLVAAILFVIRVFASGDFGGALGQAVGSAVTGSLILIGAATVGAWLLERQGGRIAYLDRWRVRDLRALEVASWDFDTWRTWLGGRPHARHGEPAATPHAPRPQHSTVARGLALVVLGSALILWWSGVLSFGLFVDADDLRRLEISPGALEAVSWTALKALIFWPVLAYFITLALQGAVLAAWPGARRLQGAIEAGRGALLLTFCAWLVTASPLAGPLGVGSVTDFILCMATLARTPPLPLEPIVVLFVLSSAVSGFCLVVRGLWRLLTRGPRARQGEMDTISPVRRALNS